MINSINFGAKYAGSERIKKFNKLSRIYEPKKINILEIDAKNKAEIFSVRDAVKSWENAHYADSILGNICAVFTNLLDKNGRKFYALTTQKKRFKKLQSDQILGLAEVDTGKKTFLWLDYLQVNPKYKHDPARNSKYKGIGQGMLEFLKNKFNTRIMLSSDYAVTNFYEKNGFNLINSDKLHYEWVPPAAEK